MDGHKKTSGRFFCRRGMQRSGPYSRKELRALLVSGIIDANTLIGEEGSCHLQPLGASKAACEITSVARKWHRQYSLYIYGAWLIFMPLFSAGIAGMAIAHCDKSFIFFPAAMLLGNLGMSMWLFRTWQILLAGEKNSNWKAALYAFPMTFPAINFIWLWIGYMRLPRYWQRFKKRHEMPDHSPYYLYYLVMALFYLQGILSSMIFIYDEMSCLSAVRFIGGVNWIWFGLTLLSLFLTDRFTLAMIKDKLRNLAFGAVRFCADINYDVLHRTVMMLAQRSRKSVFGILGVLLLCSWMTGGWFWMKAVEVCYLEYNSENVKLLECCPFCRRSNSRSLLKY